MNDTHESRRQFLFRSATAAAMAAMLGCRQTIQHRSTTGPTTYGSEASLGVEDSIPPTFDSGKKLRVNWSEADATPLDADRIKTFHVRDLPNDPLPQAIDANGKGATVALANEPIQLSGRLKIPGFGEVYCYADNDGFGYRKPAVIDFIADAAATRVRRVLETMHVALAEGVQLSDAFKARMFDAIESLQNASPRDATSAAYRSLANSLPAGEMLAMQRATHRISQLRAPRKEFHFGVSVAGYENPAIASKLMELFNFASVSWYTWKAAYDAAAPVDYGRMDRTLDWALAQHLTPKGYGYSYMARGATPVWLRPTEDQLKLARRGPVMPDGWTFDKILALYKQVNEQTLTRYRDRLPYIEVINEAHDKANLWRFNHDQIVTLTRESCAAARRGSPSVKRQINHCCLWAEYGKTRNPDGSRRWSPYRYLRDCVDGGAQFESIGLQLYYPTFDLFEIERMLDRFKQFGKPLHITEIATASQPGQDAASMRPRSAPPAWHGEWNETTQADWLEAIYTLCYSKPEFECVGWWDVSDGAGHFWPFGGVLRSDFTPKESYLRLQKLQKDWGVAKS